MKSLQKLIITSLLTTTCAYADNEAINHMINANDNITGYTQAIEQAKKTSHVTVEFPAFIPKPATEMKYFASVDAHSQQYGFEYMINIDSTPDCHGVKYCNIGIISARKSDKVEMMKNRKHKIITVPVMMADGINAFYTPGHAMGDFFPATIQWVDGGSLYTISWAQEKMSDNEMRDFLVTMASSAKHPGSG